MTYSRLIATAMLAVLPLAAIADGAFSPSVRIYAGERGIDFVTTSSTLWRADVVAQGDADPGSIRVSNGERAFVFDAAPSTLSRAEVRAELRAAQRLGLLTYGEAGPPITTPQQEAMIARAGDAAATMQASAPNARR